MPKLFGEQLAAARKKLGLSSGDLAKLCGVSRSYITLIENGKRLPGKKVLPKIAPAIGLPGSVVLNWYLEDIRTRVSS